VIEFVLGTVSNTASYLRLWALSLAHSQLAKVFFEKTIGAGIEANSIVGIIIGFLVFAPVTMFVLMFMDVMECFLHDLRLHWVEF
jgi:V-type H+-transporting ATPase subunit a